MIAQIGHEQEDERAAVFFLRDGAGGRQGGEKGHEHQHDERVDLEEQQAEAGGVAEFRLAAEPARRQPGGHAERPEHAERGGSHGVMAGPTGHRAKLAGENRAKH